MLTCAKFRSIHHPVRDPGNMFNSLNPGRKKMYEHIPAYSLESLEKGVLRIRRVQLPYPFNSRLLIWAMKKEDYVSGSGNFTV